MSLYLTRRYSRTRRGGHTHHRQQEGFTLLEVLVALAILATALAALVTSTGGQAGHAAYLQEKTFAHWVARNELTRLRLLQRQTGLPPDAINNGSTELAGREWYWRSEVQSSTDQSVRRVTISVFDDPRQENTLETLRGFLPLEVGSP